MSEAPRVLCVGHVNWDVLLKSESIPTPDSSASLDSFHELCGGSAANTALGLASFGSEVAVSGVVGTDSVARNIRDSLDEYGVIDELTAIEGDSSTVIALSVGSDDPRYLTQYGALDEFTVEDARPSNWEEYDHLHLTSALPPIMNSLAEEAEFHGLTVSFNPTQGYEAGGLSTVIEVADLVVFNENEYQRFSDEYTVEEVRKGTAIIVTYGSEGSEAYLSTQSETNCESPVEVPAVELDGDEIQDFVGAGDAFVAGLLSEFLSGVEMSEALATASGSGAYAVTHTGCPDSIDPEWVASRSPYAE